MRNSSDYTDAYLNAGDLLANPELLQKEAARVGELFSNKVETPHGMNKGIKTPQDFMRILDNNEALNADWAKFCDVGKDDF